MFNLFIGVHLSKAKLTLFPNGSCFLASYTVSMYYYEQMLQRVLADCSTNLLHNELYDGHSFRFDVELQGVTPFVLQVYFLDHTESLGHPIMVTQPRIPNSHSDFRIGSTFWI